MSAATFNFNQLAERITERLTMPATPRSLTVTIRTAARQGCSMSANPQSNGQFAQANSAVIKSAAEE